MDDPGKGLEALEAALWWVVMGVFVFFVGNVAYQVLMEVLK